LFLPQNDAEYVHFENSQDHPFEHRLEGFSRRNAWWLADAALLAYWSEAPANAIWARANLQFTFLSRDGIQCHVGWTNTFVIVAFRGTQPDEWQDLFDIIRIRHQTWALGGKVHSGFLDAHNRIWESLEEVLKELDPTRRAVWFCGHSLGGALATLSMDRLQGARGLYTIGSPRVGDRQFAESFDRRHPGRCFRYVNHRDVVTHMPPVLTLTGSYQHLSGRRYIDEQGSISRGVASIADSLWLPWTWRLAVRAVGDVATPVAALPDALVDHTPRRYAVHIWNDYVAHPSTSAVVATR
jgi:triacylglycerol lipase